MKCDTFDRGDRIKNIFGKMQILLEFEGNEKEGMFKCTEI